MSHLCDLQHLFAASSGLAPWGSLGSPWLLCQRATWSAYALIMRRRLPPTAVTA